MALLHLLARLDCGPDMTFSKWTGPAYHTKSQVPCEFRILAELKQCCFVWYADQVIQIQVSPLLVLEATSPHIMAGVEADL